MNAGIANTINAAHNIDESGITNSVFSPVGLY
jgi:hypothetical protein